jgi:hypothetical protein
MDASIRTFALLLALSTIEGQPLQGAVWKTLFDQDYEFESSNVPQHRQVAFTDMSQILSNIVMDEQVQPCSSVRWTASTTCGVHGLLLRP